MRLLVLPVFLVATGAAPALAQDASVPVRVDAEACLRERASAAVEASAGGADAARFLLDYLCAEPVERATTYARNSRTLDLVNTMGSEDGEAGSAPPFSVYPVTGDLVPADGGVGVDDQLFAARMIGGLGGFGSNPASEPAPLYLRVLAGEVVLAERTP